LQKRATHERYNEERPRREMFLDATRRSRIETRQRRHKSLYEARKTRRSQVCGGTANKNPNKYSGCF